MPSPSVIVEDLAISLAMASRLLAAKQSQRHTNGIASPNEWLAICHASCPLAPQRMKIPQAEVGQIGNLSYAQGRRIFVAMTVRVAVIARRVRQARQSPSVIASRLLPAKQSLAIIACCLVLLLSLTACAKGSNQLNGWTALQPEMDLKAEPDGGPNGETVLAMLYTLFPGKDYTIEHPMPIAGLEGRPSLRLTAKATRVLYLAVVLLDREGHPHECARTLQAGEWRTLEFDAFEPAIDDWSQITAIRFVDRTALLVSQGPVSLKLVGLPQ